MVFVCSLASLRRRCTCMLSMIMTRCCLRWYVRFYRIATVTVVVRTVIVCRCAFFWHYLFRRIRLSRVLVVLRLNSGGKNDGRKNC